MGRYPLSFTEDSCHAFWSWWWQFEFVHWQCVAPVQWLPCILKCIVRYPRFIFYHIADSCPLDLCNMRGMLVLKTHSFSFAHFSAFCHPSYRQFLIAYLSEPFHFLWTLPNIVHWVKPLLAQSFSSVFWISCLWDFLIMDITSSWFKFIPSICHVFHVHNIFARNRNKVAMNFSSSFAFYTKESDHTMYCF